MDIDSKKNETIIVHANSGDTVRNTGQGNVVIDLECNNEHLHNVRRTLQRMLKMCQEDLDEPIHAHDAVIHMLDELERAGIKSPD